MKSSILKIENVRNDYALQEHDQATVSYIKIHWKLVLWILPSPMLHAFNILICLLKAIKVIAISCIMIIAVFHSLCLSAQTPRKDSGVNGQVKYELNGVVVSSNDGTPLQGVSVRVEAENLQVKTSKDGKFKLTVYNKSGKIRFSSIGFKSHELNYTAGVSLTVKLIPEDNQLDEVEVLSTGYQKIPKERATGSFVQIDNELLNRTVSTNVLDRLEGVTNGLVFNKNPESKSPITIRGNSTIYGNQMPLIVLDNFPYEGALSSINPNDIESITVLKDAAAASIWGIRAGNGVIVINTKRGTNQKPRVTVLSNLNLSQKPNIFYRPQLSSKEYIAMETSLFEKGYFWNISDGFSPISPIVAMLQQRKMGLISPADSVTLVDRLSTYDGRHDIAKNVYKSGFNQQYSTSVRGGSDVHTYFLSGGYDRNSGNVVNQLDERHTFTAKNTFSIWKGRVTLSSDIYFTDSKNTAIMDPYLTPRYPYDRMYDDFGVALKTVKDLRFSFIDAIDNEKMLDWSYFPAHELDANRAIRGTDYRLNHQLVVEIVKGLNFSGEYLFQKGLHKNNRHYLLQSYFTRNLINSFTQIDPNTDLVRHPIPVGGILDDDHSQYINRSGRAQLNLDKSLGRHEIHALAGYELRDYSSHSSTDRRYGYDEETMISGNNAMDFSKEFPQYYGFRNSRIPGRIANRGTIDRNRSLYFNGSYTYNSRYTLSISARRDESNLFGVKSNQKGVPLWSIGGLWKFSDENFYHFNTIPVVRLRASYGYNGNIDKSVSAYLTTLAGTGINGFGNNYLVISNPPNSSLRWEKVGIGNIGADFETASRRMSGTVEYYHKSSSDLIANSPLAPQTGVLSLKGNAADMMTTGWDVTLNSRNLINNFKWETSMLLSWVKDEITNYKGRQKNNFDIVTGNFINPLEGYPLYALFSFPYLPLDASGNPTGILDGKESQNYSGIMTNANSEDLVYSGTATPTFFGSLMNTFRYKNFDLSFNITFKSGHKYRRQSIVYSELLTNYMQADYGNRWLKAGDELKTDVPAMMYPFDTNRESLYKYGSRLVEDASSVRLKDIRLSYTGIFNKISIREYQLFFYANNIGMLWKANKHGQDPDSPLVPIPRNYAIGINANF
ncbi:SusC/RagA family TonB-linked outer membrane protein [Sphingobacterium sp. JUb56]|uniref:SusC/RagA family TonB-linked outer membrane protein n=1 Tax=Sphingobacterium sp. JUb56 TaxID=2587145 RepID=UPI00161C2195|nr:SusC/RagA family TonB-linked outer membrane protein [Sphingobacterium sp. JUb56]MBB2950638.1 TonB-linked SusC/RagA family outer membrane protein [Sphingobacterium sp. JUb56]